MSELAPLREAFALIGEDPMTVLRPGTPHVVAYGHRIVSRQQAEGVQLEAREREDAIDATLVVEEGRRLDVPVHLCFSLFGHLAVQNVELQLTVRRNARATVWSHCLFTMADAGRHAMKAKIVLEPGAWLKYDEVHYHGLSGAIEVVPRATVYVGQDACYFADFSLVQGRVGRLNIDYAVAVAEMGVAELTSRIYGHADDDIRVREVVSLDGAQARGLVKTRIAVEGEAVAEIVGATYGNARGARGHVDCLEVVRGHARAAAKPEVRVTHPEAKVTHEAAIGSVDARQLETLMARGLTPEEAVDRIVLGMLR